MDTKTQKLAERLAALSPEDRARLERLAALAKVAPEHLFPDVWEYGFDDVEEGIQADLEADEYFKTNAGIPNEEVMAKALSVIGSHAKRKRQVD